jgi:predicted nucleotidyltransferase
MITPTQQSLIDAIVRVLSADACIESAWLTGSLGKGDGDAFSDVDVTVVVPEAVFDATLGAYSGDLSAIANVVCINIVAGRVLNSIIDDWQRFDLTFVKPREFAGMPLGAIRPLFNRGTPPRQAPPDAPYKPSPQRVLQIATEFIRVLGLSPVAMGREEYLLAQEGSGIMLRLTIDLMIECNGISPIARGGHLHTNKLLTPEQRRLLESLPPFTATQDSAIGVAQALAAIFLPLAKTLAAETGARWPSSFEDATRRHLQQSLGISI